MSRLVCRDYALFLIAQSVIDDDIARSIYYRAESLQTVLAEAVGERSYNAQSVQQFKWIAGHVFFA